MKLSLLALAVLAHASPIEVEKRQTGITSNELVFGACRDVTFIFARGSTEIGNMGSVVGPPTANALKRILGSTRVAAQGVDYAALLTTNFIPTGGDPQGVRDMQSKIRLAFSKCPSTKVVVGGYSQGAAITHEALQQLDSATRNRISGAVTFGDTQNLQDLGRIPGFPRDKTKIYCAFGDLVCSGTLIITLSHLSYTADASSAARFLAGLVR